MARRMPTVGAAMRILEGLVTPHALPIHRMKRLDRGTEERRKRERVCRFRRADRERERGRKERARFPSSRRPPSLFHSLFHSRFTISVFARERGSFSLSESLSVCLHVDVYGRLCAVKRSREERTGEEENEDRRGRGGRGGGGGEGRGGREMAMWTKTRTRTRRGRGPPCFDPRKRHG